MKNTKRILVLLVMLILLSTSVGQAARVNHYNNSYYRSRSPFNLKTYVTTYKYNQNYNQTYYLQNNYNNIITISKPKQPAKVTRPSEPVIPVENNKKPDTSIDKDKSNPSPSPSPSTGVNASIEMEVVRLINAERQKAGLAPLNFSEELSKVARTKSQDMASKNYFSHSSPTYGDPFTMMKSFGIKYTIAGENIAKGFLSAESVVKGWMNSTGHRDNILNPSFATMGIGYVKANGTTYWTQMFTN